MYAVTFKNTLQLYEVNKPIYNTDQALLKIRLAGICNTDLEITRGYKGFTGILGHEFVAEVVDGIPDKIGQRVVGEINVACGECDYCLQGIQSHCTSRTTVGINQHDGAFAEYLALKIGNLHFLPDTITDEQAVFTEPLAAACEILDQIHVKPTDKVIIIGAGKLGLLCAQVLHLTGAHVSVVIRREKQAKLLNKWGIQSTYKHELTTQADIVIDCTGVENGFKDALELVRPRGTIVLKSTYEGLPQVNLTKVAVDEITIVGSRCGPFKTAINLLEHQLIDVDSMIEKEYSLQFAVEAFHYANQKGVLKVLLRP